VASPDLSQFPLLHREWNALEELALIEQIMKSGLGNWTDIVEGNPVLRKKGITPQ
jgi:hypothetical protein